MWVQTKVKFVFSTFLPLLQTDSTTIPRRMGKKCLPQMGAQVVLSMAVWCCDVSFILFSFVALFPTHSDLTYVLTHFTDPPRRQSKINISPFHLSKRNHTLCFCWFCGFTHLALDLQGEFPVASRNVWLQFTVWELVFNPGLWELNSQKKKKEKK